MKSVTALTAKPVTLLEACEDPKLLGAGLDLWPWQRKVLGAIERHRLTVLAAGRRSSKTTMAALLCLHGCLFSPGLDAMVRPGERRYSVAVATNLRQARLLVAAGRSIVERSPLLAGLVESITDDAIEFVNGTDFAAFPCTSRGGRGWPISTLAMDEAAHFLSESDGYQTAERVWEALAPSTAQFGDAARIVVCSTPFGSTGLFADLYRRAEAGELANAVALHATTAEANPKIAPDFLATEHLRDPASFRQEYGAEFTASGDAYIDWDLVTPPAKRGVLGPDAGREWVIGLDPAFSKDNFGAVIVGRHHHDRRRLLVARVEAFKSRGAFPGPLPEIVALARNYNARVVTDQYEKEPVCDFLRRHGHPARVHEMRAESKTEVFSNLRARLEDGSVELYEHPPLIAELRRLRTKFTAGRAAVVNPRVGGSHGDLAQALALAVYELRTGGSRPGRMRSGGYERDAIGQSYDPNHLSINQERRQRR